MRAPDCSSSDCRPRRPRKLLGRRSARLRAARLSSASPLAFPSIHRRTRGTLHDQLASRASLQLLRAPRAEARPLPRRRVRRGREGLELGQGARLPRVPRCLRHRDEPPRLQDPLQDPERRPAHARRARVRALDRHAGGARDARVCRSSRSRARDRSATSTSSASRSSSSSRTRTSSACSTSAASRCALGDRGEGRSARHRRRPDGDAPRAARRRSSTPSSSATARSERRRSRSSGRS